MRGIKRGHQFDKVEMYKFVEPEDLGRRAGRDGGAAPRRCCSGWACPTAWCSSAPATWASARTKTYDLEVWAPGVGEWLEVAPCSNCGDFQARRANIRFRREAGARPEYPHTLNGSGLALPRVMIAIMENYQQPDGSIRVPEPLQPYVG